MRRILGELNVSAVRACDPHPLDDPLVVELCGPSDNPTSVGSDIAYALWITDPQGNEFIVDADEVAQQLAAAKERAKEDTNG